jgi:DNA-binding NarL/FixJ family response regulator
MPSPVRSHAPVAPDPGACVLVADDEPAVRSALRLLLVGRAGVARVVEAADAAELLARARSAGPDVVILDWQLRGGRRPEELVRQLRNLARPPRIVALSSHPEDPAVGAAAGVDARVSKSDPPEYLLDAFAALLP